MSKRKPDTEKAKSTNLWLYRKQTEALNELVKVCEDRTTKSEIARRLIDKEQKKLTNTHDFVISQIRNSSTIKPYAYCNCKECCGRVVGWYEISQILNDNI